MKAWNLLLKYLLLLLFLIKKIFLAYLEKALRPAKSQASQEPAAPSAVSQAAGGGRMSRRRPDDESPPDDDCVEPLTAAPGGRPLSHSAAGAGN